MKVYMHFLGGDLERRFGLGVDDPFWTGDFESDPFFFKGTSTGLASISSSD